MSDRNPDPHPDSPPRDTDKARKDERSDVEQAVDARANAVDRGEGGREPDTFTDTGLPDGVGGVGGVTKNQDSDAQ